MDNDATQQGADATGNGAAPAQTAMDRYVENLSDQERALAFSRAVMAKMDANSESWVVADEIKRLRLTITETAARNQQGVDQMRVLIASMPKSEAEMLSLRAQAFADSLKQLGETTKRTVDSLTELTSFSQQLLETVGEYAASHEKRFDSLMRSIERTNKETHDANRADISKLAGKIRPATNALSLRDQLLLLVATSAVAIVASGATAWLVIVLLRR